MAESASESGDSNHVYFPLTIFCGDRDAEINIPSDASAHEVSTIIKQTFGVRGSFLLQVTNYDGRKTSKALKSIYLHCSTIKAYVLEMYKEFVLEIRGFSYQRGGDTLWYYQSQDLRTEVLKKMKESECKPLDFPP